MDPNDPLFGQQWHFGLIGDIRTIWNEFSGAGIHLGVYDTGIDFTNPDLVARQDVTRNVVVNGQKRNGAPNNASKEDQNHGTAVAGLIAGKANNGIGVVGVAWEASLTSVNIFDSTKPEYVNATDPTAFLSTMHQIVRFDVANHSWGPPVDFSDYSNASLASSFAGKVIAEYAYASSQGRNGLGTIIVQAAGNEGLEANGAGAHGSRYSITVAATEASGKVAAYSDYGACILVCAPGGGESRPLVTTDRAGKAGYNGETGYNGDFTDTFIGTAAATPIVSGVVTLMLQANPDLGWRDVQNILALSATRTGSAITPGTRLPTDGEASYWKMNGAQNWNAGGAHFSEDFGYGMVNVFNAVRMAEAWRLFAGAAQTSANEQSLDTGTIAFKKAIGDLARTEVGFSVKKDISLEHLDLTVNVAHEYLADLTLTLISPDGTEMEAKPLVAQGPTAPGGSSWTFGFDGFRGELSAGNWRLRLQDSVEGNAGVLNSIRLVGFGSASPSGRVFHFTDEYSEMRSLPRATNGKDIRDDVHAAGLDTPDWIDAAALHSAVIVDLGLGTATIDGKALKVSGVDNVVGGEGHDRLSGNIYDNVLHGMRNNDTLSGKGGFDQLCGGQGDDILELAYDPGITDSGVLDGGVGSDTLRLVAGADALFELNHFDIRNMERVVVQDAGQTFDTTIQLNAGQIARGWVADNAHIVGRTNALAADTLAVDMAGATRLDLQKLQFFNFTGALDKVTITGGDKAETIVGSGMRDIIDGAAGADNMSGYWGDDTYFVDNAGDLVDEHWTNSVGVDTVLTSVTFNLGDTRRVWGDVENATLLGTASLNLWGNALINRLTGNGGANFLDGATNADVMAGLGGNDTYVIDNAADVADESLAGSGGTDLVRSASISLNLGIAARFKGAIENAALTGTANLNLSGNALGNLLVGNSGNNTLDGATGADVLRGLAGDDTYVVDNAGDVVDEAVAGSSGTDTVRSAVLSINLADAASCKGAVEHAALTGTAALNLTGNALANLLTGNAGANTLDGGTGADTLRGLAGDDTYIVDNAGDVVDEAASGSAGIDTVRSSLIGINLLDSAHFLGTIENATLLGEANLNLFGNGRINLLTGNAGSNLLDGSFGGDTMRGLRGNDTYVVDSADDIVDEAASGSNGADTATSAKLSLDLRDAAHFRGTVENAALTGTARLDLTGNALLNTLTGNAAANVLNGRESRDTLSGGGGDDTFVFDTALGGGNTDTITDFGSASGDNDAIRLAKSIFTALMGTVGTMLSADQFVANATGAAQDDSDRILYNTQTGALFYDADGTTSGGAAKLQFAQLGLGTTHPALTNADFFLA